MLACSAAALGTGHSAPEGVEGETADTWRKKPAPKGVWYSLLRKEREVQESCKPGWEKNVFGCDIVPHVYVEQ